MQELQARGSPTVESSRSRQWMDEERCQGMPALALSTPSWDPRYCRADKPLSQGLV